MLTILPIERTGKERHGMRWRESAICLWMDVNRGCPALSAVQGQKALKESSMKSLSVELDNHNQGVIIKN